MCWLSSAALIAALPIPVIKKYIETKNLIWVFVALFLYSLLVYLYTVILKSKDMIIVYPLLKVLSALIVILSGISFFNSKLNIESGIGIFLGLCSLYFLSKDI